MSNEPDYIMDVMPEEVQPLLQYFFNYSGWGDISNNQLPVKEKEWAVIIKDFIRQFKYDPFSQVYMVSNTDLFNFVNNQIQYLLENTMLDMVDLGLMELLVDKNGNICFRNKKEKI